MYVLPCPANFKIFCRDYQTACKVKIAVTKWLKERLKLDISDEKSKITNLKNNYSEYLGLKMKVHRKGIKVYSNGRQKEKFVVKSMMSNKAVNRLINNLKMQIKTIQHSEKPKYEIAKLNQMIFGYHNYYDSATHVCKSFHIIEYKVMKCMKNRLKELKTSNGSRNKVIEKNYGESKACCTTGSICCPSGSSGTPTTILRWQAAWSRATSIPMCVTTPLPAGWPLFCCSRR